MTSSDPVIVDREAWQVRYVEGLDDPTSARACWEQLEGLLPSLRGRAFAAAFDADAGWYRACVRVASDPGSAELRLPVTELPGGRFLRLRLIGDPPELYERLPGAFDLLRAAGSHDASRPSIEHYRSHHVVDALLPILS
jgi:hypothetical protein